MSNEYCAPVLQSIASSRAAAAPSSAAVPAEVQNFQFGPNVTVLASAAGSAMTLSCSSTENSARPSGRNRNAAPSLPPVASANVIATCGALPSAGTSNTQVD